MSAFKRLAYGALAATILVILWGAVVRATGSGAGCGSHWPTCNGEVVPHPKSVATLIEVTHRATSGLDLIAVVALLVVAWRSAPSRHLARTGAIATMVLMITEALVGAGLVLLEHVAKDSSTARAGWVALHLTNTFLLVAALTVTAWAADRDRPVFSDTPAAKRLRALGLLGALLALLVGTSGAITALGDTLFPARTFAEGLAADASTSAHLFVKLRVFHPVLALVLAATLGGLARVAPSWRQGPELRGAARFLEATVVAQIVVGSLNLGLLAPVSTQILHLLVGDLLWIALVRFVLVTTTNATADATPEVAAAPDQLRA